MRTGGVRMNVCVARALTLCMLIVASAGCSDSKSPTDSLDASVDSTPAVDAPNDDLGVDDGATVCTCVSDSDCSDGLFCNGTETCAGCTEMCVPGVPVACTPDSACDEAMDACVASTCALRTPFYRDADGDGFGDAATGAYECTAPTGFTASAGDCDDTDARANPLATEICDGSRDDDCDGTVDERCPCTPGATRVCGVMRGSCTRGTQSCTGVWSDCAGGVGPVPEACNTTDDDCDGAVDEAAESAAACGGVPCIAGSCATRRVAGVSMARDSTAVWTGDGALFIAGNAPGDSASTVISSVLPVRIGATADALGAATSTGGVFGATRSRDGWLHFWGAFTYPGELARAPLLPTAGTSGATSFALGGAHACFVRAGRVLCLGSNTFGELGDGTFERRSLPVEASTIMEAVEVVALSNTTCARVASGAVFCWGAGGRGELGNGVLTPSVNVPVRVTGLDDAIDLAAGEGHVCAQRASGAIACWGDNTFGQLGDGSRVARDAPRAVSVALPAGTRLAVTLGSTSTCVLAGDGSVRCWGRNEDGELGDDSGIDSLTGVAVSALSGRVGLAGGATAWCAWSPDRVDCWGRSDAGALGDGTNTRRFAPVRMLDVP